MSVGRFLSRREVNRVIDIVIQRLVGVRQRIAICILQKVGYFSEFSIAIVELAAVDLLGQSHVSQILNGERTVDIASSRAIFGMQLRCHAVSELVITSRFIERRLGTSGDVF